MIEKEKSLVEFHQRRQCFIQKAIEEGAHEKEQGASRSRFPANWDRIVNIGIAYNFGEAILVELGNQYRIKKQQGSLDLKCFIGQLWKNLSRELQVQHPITELFRTRSWPQSLRGKRSKLKEGIED